MTGKLIPATIHGKVLSILLARASSSAPALYGLANNEATEMCAGEPGWREEEAVELLLLVCRREGERSGEEKERR